LGVTVGELIEKLSAFDRNQPVLVTSYEFGFEEPKDPRAAQVRAFVTSKTYRGDFDEVGDDHDDAQETILRVVVIERQR
jgi:hypothetical protein